MAEGLRHVHLRSAQYANELQSVHGRLSEVVIVGQDKSVFGAAGDGVVFKLDSSGNETVLHTFNVSEGGPKGDLVRSASGNLYGTTFRGGRANAGEVFKLDPAGNLTVLHTFTGADGANPDGNLLRDDAGNLYGVTTGGGSAGYGVVFELTH